jgi:hypothetical protein
MPGARRRSMAELLQEQRALTEPAAADAAAAPGPVPAPAVPAAIAASSVPEPHSPAGHGQLSDGEEADLATCEAALDNLRVAFWAAGKALQVIRDGRLYRNAHDTFEDYVEQRWDMSRAQAYRLIDAWPLAERLSPIGDKITESQVRELLPLAGRHGPDAAAAVYQTVAEGGGVRVTAAVLRDIVSILRSDRFDQAEAVLQIRGYLAGERAAKPLASADPVETFAIETARLVKVLQRVATGDAIRAARTADPDSVRHALASIRAMLDEIERQVTP